MIVPSNYTTIGAWINSKMSGRKPTAVLYNYINRHACRDTKQNKDKIHDKLGLQLTLLHCVYDQMGIDEGNLQVIDVDVILENCPITIPLRYILTSSGYSVYYSHYILHS